MSVDKDTVRRIAKLARIALEEERVAPMERELNGILAWVEQLQEVKGIGPGIIAKNKNVIVFH